MHYLDSAVKKSVKNKPILMNPIAELKDTTGVHKLLKDIQRANRMLRPQKKKLLEEKNALKRWGEDLHLLNDLSKSVVATLDTDSIVLNAYEKMQEIVPHDILSVVLFKQKKLWLLSNIELDVEEIAEIKALGFSAINEIKDISEEKEDYKTVVKYFNRDNYKNSDLKFKISNKSLNRLFFPMETGDQRIGGLQLISHSDKPFSEHQYNIISMIVSTLTLALRNSEIHREVQEMATTDSLTGLFNKRHFCDALTKEFKVSMRYQTPVSLIMIDLDKFKSINDQFGHQAGDAVLKDVTSLLTRSLREIDIPARYGGDEIAIILPETIIEQAFFVAKRIKRLIENHSIKFDHRAINVTASFGISSCPNPMIKTVEEMISVADKALYDAKRCGRNRIETNDNIFAQDNAYLGPLVF